MAGQFRYVIVLLLFLGLVVDYMLQVSMSVTLICMINHTALRVKEQEAQRAAGSVGQAEQNLNAAGKTSQACNKDGGNGDTNVREKDGEFHWDEQTQSLILSAFYYGYVITELPGGWLAYRFGGKWVFAIGILGTSILTLLIPLGARLQLGLLIFLRVMKGIGEGVAFPCVHALFSQWVPPEERSRMSAVTDVGQGIGTVVGFALAARLCNTRTGWPLVFYIYGLLGLVWVCLWTAFGSSSPASSRWISDEEKSYIQSVLAETVTKDETPSFRSVPWRRIFTTASIWAVWISDASASWGYFTLLTLLPTFFKEALQMRVKENGLFSALPYVCFTVVAVCAGPVCDYILKKNWASVTVVRKVADSLGHILPGLFLLLATTVGCNISAAVAIMCIAIGSGGLISVGSQANNLDVAGRFAGITNGISNTFGSIAGFVAPTIAGAITKGTESIERWRIVFGIAAAIYWLSAIVYILMASGEAADWAKVNMQNHKDSWTTRNGIKTPNTLSIAYLDLDRRNGKSRPNPARLKRNDSYEFAQGAPY